MAAATGRGTTEFNREQILLDGFLKHREAGSLVTRWRHRYVVFKVASAGKLTFIIYKDKQLTPANELHEIPIEEYGGLDCTLKMEGERHAFAIITTHSTECFATDSQEVLQEWSHTIREYLGKELILSISVPYKQNMLKAGRAQMRIRNTGFTITTADVPPKCQGSWQILHIRKFGGSEQFRFETGSKCPSGQYLYVIDTNDNEKMKTVFTDLSMHKPIFIDDRMGRRMTQEHNVLLGIRGKMNAELTHQRLASRRSLQTHEATNKYENQSQLRRTSVQHETLRTRSNAILLQDPSDFNICTLPSHLTRERTYYNSHDIDRHEQLRLLTTPPTNQRANSEPPEEHLYYNQHPGPSPSHRATPKSRLRSSDDSDEDDFVDVHEIIDAPKDGNVYCNVFRTPAHTTTKGNDNLVYINFIPTQSLINRSCQNTDGAGKVVEEDIPVYTNVTIPPKRSSTAQEVSASHSDSELSPIISRHKITTLINTTSTDHTSLSCEDISSPPPPLSNGLITDNSNYHSDTELFQLKTSSLSNKRSPSPLVMGRHDDKKMRPPAYDHLEPVKQSESTLNQQDSNDDVSLSPEKVSTADKNMWLTRRVHTYEDIDLPIDNRSSSSSPDSTFNEATPPPPQSLYQRKLSIIGRGHSYEQVEKYCPDPISAIETKPTSPTRSLSPHYNLSYLSQSRPPLPWQHVSHDESEQATPPVGNSHDSPRHKLKKPVPTPRMVKPESGKQEEGRYHGNGHTPRHASPSSHSRNSDVKKSPPSLGRESPSHAPTLPPRLVKDTVTTTNNYKSQILKGLPHSNEVCSSSIEKRPALPPRIREEQYCDVSTNYVPIYIRSGPRQSQQSNTLTFTPTTSKRIASQDISVNYTDINHFLTRQVQTMREEREIEKGLAAPL